MFNIYMFKNIRSNLKVRDKKTIKSCTPNINTMQSYFEAI